MLTGLLSCSAFQHLHWTPKHFTSTTTFTHQQVSAAMQGAVCPNWSQLRSTVLSNWHSSIWGRIWTTNPLLSQPSPSRPSSGSFIILWGFFSESGAGDLIKVEGIIYKVKYVEILKEKLQQSAVKLGLDPSPHLRTWQPSWTCISLAGELSAEETRVNVMEWPAQSSDWNPIGNTWSEFQKHSPATRPSILNVRDLPKKKEPGFLKMSVRASSWRAVLWEQARHVAPSPVEIYNTRLLAVIWQ